MVNYSAFNYYDFIEYAKSLETDEEKIKFVTDYVKHYCEYDYAFMVLAYMHGSGLYDFDTNYERVDPKGTYFENYPDCSQITHILSLNSFSTTSYLFADIINSLDSSDLSLLTYKKNINNIKIVIYNFLCNFLKDTNLIDYYVGVIIDVLEKELKKTYFNDRMTKYVKTMDVCLAEMCDNIHYLFQREYNKGLITKGVCEGFSDFVVRALEDLDIPCVKVLGSQHAWNLAKVNNEYIMIDTTNSQVDFDISSVSYNSSITTKKDFDKDKTKNVDWNHMTLDELFEASPDREIYQIGDYRFDDVINSDNYNTDEVLKLIDYAFENDVCERREEKAYALKMKQ